jgi:hypothetical protein
MQDVDPKHLIVQPVEFGGVPRLRLKDVYAVYTGQFRRWFAITAPTSLLGSAILLMADQRIRDIYHSFPAAQISHHAADVAEAGVLRYGSFLIRWFLECFALAAVATVVNGLAKGERDDIWISDSFQRAREHFGPLLRAAVVTSSIFLAGMAAIELILISVVRVFGWPHFARFNYASAFVGVIVISSIVSWFGMAVPLILSENIGAWAALKRSLNMSDGYEGFLSLLVCESVLGSFVAGYAVHYGLTFLFPTELRYTESYGWFVSVVTILASAAVQPPMFIGFSLLAAEGTTNSSRLPRPQHLPHID